MIDPRTQTRLDAIDAAISITAAIRDRENRVLDFRVEFVNLSASRWAGLPREAMTGRIAGEILPGFRRSGAFDAFEVVVETGEPLEATVEYEDVVTGGRVVTGSYEIRAVRHGDGYLNAWREAGGEGPRPTLREIVDAVQAEVDRGRSKMRGEVMRRAAPAT